MNVTEKTMLPVQKKKKNRFLITINILGSTGPIKFVVNEDDLVAAVIETALKTYAREGRLPALGLDVNNFSLYPANEGSLGLCHHMLTLLSIYRILYHKIFIYF